MVIKIRSKIFGLFNHSCLQIKIITHLPLSALKSFTGIFLLKKYFKKQIFIMPNVFAEQKTLIYLQNNALHYCNGLSYPKNAKFTKIILQCFSSWGAQQRCHIIKFILKLPLWYPNNCYAKNFMVKNIVCEKNFQKQEVTEAQNFWTFFLLSIRAFLQKIIILD